MWKIGDFVRVQACNYRYFHFPCITGMIIEKPEGRLVLDNNWEIFELEDDPDLERGNGRKMRIRKSANLYLDDGETVTVRPARISCFKKWNAGTVFQRILTGTDSKTGRNGFKYGNCCLKLNDQQAYDLQDLKIRELSGNEKAESVSLQVKVKGIESCPDRMISLPHGQSHRTVHTGTRCVYGNVMLQFQNTLGLVNGYPTEQESVEGWYLTTKGCFLRQVGSGRFYDFDHQMIRPQWEDELRIPLNGKLVYKFPDKLEREYIL